MPVTFPDPEVFIDCRDAPLLYYGWKNDIPIINVLDEKNRPSNDMTQMIAAGRAEHRTEAIVVTLGLTITATFVVLKQLFDKANNAKIRYTK